MKAAALIGVLVMAHGGDPAWNEVVEEAVAPLRAKHPTALAYGMADSDALQHAVYDLERRGVRKIAVVRLFLSGDSFLTRTEKILGLKPGAGYKAELAVGNMKDIVMVAPSQESVLLVAHGVGDDKVDRRWRDAMLPAVAAVKKAAPFRKVTAVTLRDDWPEAHAKAVAEIKAFVAEAKGDGGRALVVPYRLYGFGPQSSSLEGLDIVTDDKGLLPDPSVAAWLVAESDRLIKEAGW
ncbi:MAG: hypothetical protein FD126_1601 [Elusimicrobia bacterium]|nr:MAG: hypothetical protein FD126_1601 [Elusimicrobiota bacterium]